MQGLGRMLLPMVLWEEVLSHQLTISNLRFAPKVIASMHIYLYMQTVTYAYAFMIINWFSVAITSDNFPLCFFIIFYIIYLLFFSFRFSFWALKTFMSWEIVLLASETIWIPMEQHHLMECRLFWCVITIVIFSVTIIFLCYLNMKYYLLFHYVYNSLFS